MKLGKLKIGNKPTLIIVPHFQDCDFKEAGKSTNVYCSWHTRPIKTNYGKFSSYLNEVDKLYKIHLRNTTTRYNYTG